MGAAFFVMAACAVVMTVFNDLGAIATRNDTMAGKRLAAKDTAADTRTELERIAASVLCCNSALPSPRQRHRLGALTPQATIVARLTGGAADLAATVESALLP
jgi:hypothetical protein